MVVHFKARSIGVFATQKKSDWINYKKSQENLYKNTTQTQKNELIHKCADKIDGLILVLETLRRNEAVQHTASTILFLSTSLLALGIQGGLPSHTLRITSQGTNFFCLGKKTSTRKTLSSSHTTSIPTSLFVFSFSSFLSAIAVRAFTGRVKGKNAFRGFSFFASALRTWTRNSILPLLTLALTTCFCPLAHFSPGHALRIRSAAPFLDWISACGFRMATGI